MTPVRQHIPCRADPELHFPPGYTGAAAQRQIAQAKAVCGGCPVLARCCEWALANPEMTTDGITGGLTPDERRRLRLAEHQSSASRCTSSSILSASPVSSASMPVSLASVFSVEVPA